MRNTAKILLGIVTWVIALYAVLNLILRPFEGTFFHMPKVVDYANLYAYIILYAIYLCHVAFNNRLSFWKKMLFALLLLLPITMPWYWQEYVYPEYYKTSTEPSSEVG